MLNVIAIIACILLSFRVLQAFEKNNPFYMAEYAFYMILILVLAK